MQIYHLLQILLFSYCIVAGIAALISVPFKRATILTALNNAFAGKKFLLIPFRIFSVSALLAWLILALPLLDMMTGSHFITSWDDKSVGRLITYFGAFEGQAGNIYFVTVFTGVLAVKAHWVLGKMAHILTDDHLAMNKSGEWGSVKEMGSMNILPIS